MLNIEQLIKRSSISRIALGCMIVVCLLLTAQPSLSQDSKTGLLPIKVGAILHLTGDLSMQGKAFQEGLVLAAKEINSKGGVHGRPLEVIFEDSQLQLATVRTAAKKLLELDKVSVAFISTFDELKVAGPMFEAAKVPVVCLWDSTPELDAMGEFLFSIGTWLPSTGEVSADFAIEKLGAKKAAVIMTNRDWSLRVGNDFSTRFAALGGEVVFSDSYNPGEATFSSLLLRLKGVQPDVLYAPIDDAIGAFFRRIRELQLNFPVIESDNLNGEWIRSTGGALEGVYQSQSADPSNARANAFSQTFQSYYNRAPTQLLFNGWGWDGMHLVAEAIRRKGARPIDIQAGLYTIANFPGVIGNITITREGSHRVGVSMFQIRDGKFVLVNRDG